MNINDFDCAFRPADPSDYSQLHALIQTCWIEVYSPHVPKQIVRGFLRQDGVGQHLDTFLPSMEVAVVNGSVIGVINRTGKFVTALFVAKRFRGNRIGSSLLHNAEVGGGRYLEVAAFNRRAVSFYEARGWRKLRNFEEDVFGAKLKSFAMIKHTAG